MWVFTKDCFVSIVEHRDDKRWLCVRGRFPGDVARLLRLDPKYEEVTPDADYRYRVVSNRYDVAQALARSVRGVNYENFKNSLVDDFRRLPAERTWEAWLRAQEDHARRRNWSEVIFGPDD